MASASIGQIKHETEVMIAGGGPIGLCLGIVLSHHGVPCFLAERNEHTTRHPKMDVTNCRTMEIFRRLGIADRLRAAGVPVENNMDVSWVTHMSGHELYRFRYPSVVEKRKIIRAVNDGTQPLEPNMRISQILVEPAMRDVLLERPSGSVRYGWAVESFEDDGDGVTTTIRQVATGKIARVRSRFLVGCDGGGSLVRKQLGIPLEGDAGLRPRFQIHFRSTDLSVLQRWGVAWHYQTSPYGVMICQDDKEIWTLNATMPPGKDPKELDPRELLWAFLGTQIDCEILQANPFVVHLLVAESYRKGRVFLAGDSAHQYIPTGGYGMNTGVGDAFDLGWKLAAVHGGWAGPHLLDSYERDRRPVGLRNREGSRRHADMKQKVAAVWNKDLVESRTPEGDRARAVLGEQLRGLGNLENEALGIELGYRYDDSPVVCAEEGTPPALELANYRPTTWPGARPPSVFLADGRALFDEFGREFTLLDFAGADTSGLEAAARKHGVPMKVLRVADAHARQLYERDLVLVRPDQHVAWRGNRPPPSPETVIDRVRGAA